jgi:iron complex outermembrane receptor protein
MKRGLFTVFLAALAAAPDAAAQQTAGTIRGAVVMQNGAPIHDATVVLMPLRRSAQTGDDGSFQIQNIPPGRYEVIAHQHAFTDEKRTVQVAAGATVEIQFRLDFAPVRQEITVTASGREESTLETFSSVTSLDGHQLSVRNGAPSLGELLDHEVGVAKRSFGPGTSRPVVRGFDGDRVLVLQDGARTGTLSSQSGDHGEPVEGSALERVEVVRGPATLLYGSNAIGGVVNVITRHHELDQHPHDGIRGHLTGVAGSANGLGGGTAGLEIGKGHYLFWASGGGQRTGDCKTPIGTVENSGARIVQTTAGLGRYGDKSFFTLNYGLQDGLYGVPPIELETGPEESHAHSHVNIDWRRHNARLHGGVRNLEGALESFRATVNYSDWRHFELEEDEIATRFSNRQWTAQGIFQQNRRGPLTGSFGAWAMTRDFDTRGAEALSPPVDHKAYALFGIEELGSDRVRFQFGGRLEHNDYKPAGLQRRSFTGVSGAAGIHLPTWTNGALIFNYTTSYRAPALEELYNNGPHLGNLAFEIGSPDLVRERGHGLELSLRHSGQRVRAEISGYYNRMLDFVYLAPTGEIEEGLIAAEYDQADARYAGVDARLDFALRRYLWLNLGFDVVDAELRRTGTPLPRIPPLRGRIGFDLRRGGLNLRPELALANRQSQVFPTETETAGYAVVNLIGTYTIAGAHAAHMFGLNVFNLGDRLYRNHLSFIKEFAPELGRGVRFSYTVNFY